MSVFSKLQVDSIYEALKRRKHQIIEQCVTSIILHRVFDENSASSIINTFVSETIPKSDSLEWISQPVYRIDSVSYNTLTTVEQRKSILKEENIPMLELYGEERQLHHFITQSVLDKLEKEIGSPFILRYSCTNAQDKQIYTVFTYELFLVLNV